MQREALVVVGGEREKGFMDFKSTFDGRVACLLSHGMYFNLQNFEEFCSEVCPFIIQKERSTSEPQIRRGCCSKLSLEHRLLNFI